MKLIIDIPEELAEKEHWYTDKEMWTVIKAAQNGTPIPDSDNSKNGKEVLIKYCLEHSGEEIYNLLKRLVDASMNWTDSRGFIIEWLENGGYMI